MANEFVIDRGFISLGGSTLPYVSVTGTYSITSDDHFIDCTTDNDFSVTLPTAAGIAGKNYTIKNSGNGIITVDTTSSQTIDGSLTMVLTNGKILTVVSTNSSWFSDYVAPGETISYQSGEINGASFSGTPLSYNVSFMGSFTQSYNVFIDSPVPRSWYIENEELGGFTLNSNSSTSFTYSVKWSAIEANTATIGSMLVAPDKWGTFTPTYTDGIITSFTVNNIGTGLNKEATINRTDGIVTDIVTVYNGVTLTTVFNRDSNGNITSIEKIYS